MPGWKSANKKAAGITDVREVMASPKKDRAVAISQLDSGCSGYGYPKMLQRFVVQIGHCSKQKQIL